MPPLQQVLGSALAAMSPPADSVAPRCPRIEPHGSDNTYEGETAMAAQRGVARALAQCEAAGMALHVARGGDWTTSWRVAAGELKERERQPPWQDASMSAGKTTHLILELG